MRTTEGSEALVRAVVEAAADHLSRRLGACSPWSTASWPTPARATSCAARTAPSGPTCARCPTRSGEHLLDQVAPRGADDDDGHDAEAHRRHLHVPVRLDGRVVGGFVAWTPAGAGRSTTPTTRCCGILAGQTAAALQNCALLDHSARLLARSHPPGRRPDQARNDELLATQAELGAARQREVLDDERHRIARELHDSVTQYALSAGMHIELVRTEIADDRLRAQLDTAKDLTRRAVEQLRSAIYALHRRRRASADEDLPSMLRRLSGVHMPDELRVEVRIGGEPVALPRRVRAVAVPDRRRGAVQHRRARRREPGGGAAGLRRRPGPADDLRRRRAGVPRRCGAACGRRAWPCPSGEHRGLVNMAARARELGGSLTFRRARLGGLQVQVDVPTPRAADGTARENERGRR